MEWNVTSAGWQVTLCDPIWHVSSSSGVATSVSKLLYPCYFNFTLLYNVARAEAYLHAKFHLDPSNRVATIHQRHRQDMTGQTGQTDRLFAQLLRK